jgi:hypothetical protein
MRVLSTPLMTKTGAKQPNDEKSETSMDFQPSLKDRPQPRRIFHPICQTPTFENKKPHSADGFLADAAAQVKRANSGPGRATRGVGSAPLQEALSSVQSIRADLERRESELTLREVSSVLSRVLDEAAERHEEELRAALLSKLQVRTYIRTPSASSAKNFHVLNSG